MGVVVLAVVAVPLASAGERSANVSGDVTPVSVNVAGFSVETTLTSRVAPSTEVFPQAEPGQFPDIIRVARALRIKVNGRELFVPRSVYLDLAWVTSMEVTASKGRGWLTIHGGDASESYYVKIEFDAQGLRSRSLYSSMLPNTPMQQTRYFSRSLK